MLGNDIIDIEETKARTNWQRQGFLDKLFSPYEKNKIQESLNPFHLVWRLWSMKESAYKVSIQSGYPRLFNPSSIHCKIISSKKGLISIGGIDLSSETRINQEYILTVASPTNNSIITTKILKLHTHNFKAQQKVLYQQILAQVALELQFSKDELTIQKTNLNIPYISYKNKKIESHLSISHHGKYGVFSLNTNQNI